MPAVRKTVVEQLTMLYEDPDIMDSMQLFTERFKVRLGTMIIRVS